VVGTQASNFTLLSSITHLLSVTTTKAMSSCQSGPLIHICTVSIACLKHPRMWMIVVLCSIVLQQCVVATMTDTKQAENKPGHNLSGRALLQSTCTLQQGFLNCAACSSVRCNRCQPNYAVSPSKPKQCIRESWACAAVWCSMAWHGMAWRDCMRQLCVCGPSG
jgi:hypothetical protein